MSEPRRAARGAAALGLWCAAAACDPGGFAAIQLVPRPAVGVDSAAHAAFALAARLAARRGLAPIDRGVAQGNNDEGWRACHTRGSLFVCGKVRGREVQFILRQMGRLSPTADSLRRELVDSLGAEFGAERVRGCRWVNREAPGSGCAPLAPRDSA
jgi:hypothetical protein